MKSIFILVLKPVSEDAQFGDWIQAKVLIRGSMADMLLCAVSLTYDFDCVDLQV